MHRLLIALPAVALLAACSSTGGTAPAPQSSAQIVADWFNGTPKTSFDAMQADLAAMQAANTAGSDQALITACGKLAGDAGTFSGHLPSPDQQLTADMQKVTDAATNAGAACVTGEVDTAAQQILLMNSGISAANARLDDLISK